MMNPTQTAQAFFQVCVLEPFAETAAHRFVNFCEGLIHQQGRIQVALTGGSTARPLYELLGRADVRGQLDMTAIEFYEGDERPVAADNPASNWGMAEALFLDPAGVPPENRFRMQAESRDLDEAARQYEELLRQKLRPNGGTPTFDLLLLGMGDDGHTASLFPGTAALHEHQRLVVANPVPQLKTTRLTITYPVINAARCVWILVSGAQKAEMVHRALEQREPGLPIVDVQPRFGPLTWLLDADAASRLSPRIIGAE